MGGTGSSIPSSFPAGVTPPSMGANTTPSMPSGFTLPTAGTNLPEWAAKQWAGLSPADQAKLQTSPPPTSAPVAMPGPTAAPVANLGFPTAAPSAAPGFTSASYAAPSGELPHIGAPDTVVPAAAAAAEAAKPETSPMDWVYPGNLPMNFNSTGVDQFGKPLPYSPTGANYTAGYGAVGQFGGQVGYGPEQKGLQDQVLLPQMAAGTQLTGAQIDQYNRVRREDYDRYMKLYGVGYDLPAYQRALNGLVAQQNAVTAPYNYYGSGG